MGAPPKIGVDSSFVITMEPWQGDQCSLVEAFRSGERSPAEEVDAVLAAIESSDLNDSRSSTPTRLVPQRRTRMCRSPSEVFRWA